MFRWLFDDQHLEITQEIYFYPFKSLRFPSHPYDIVTQLFDNLLELMAEDKLFDTPFLKYLYAKEIYLKQFRSYEAWGKNVSRGRTIALDSLLHYMKKNMNLADKYPEELGREVIVGNKILVYDINVLPNMPLRLREELVEAACGENLSYEEQLERIMEKVEKMKTTGCLTKQFPLCFS